MPDDPMDRPPVADHGADRYDYVEVVNAPPGVDPVGAWWEAAMAAPCPDCRANLFARWIGGPARTAGWRRADPAAWHLTVAHDSGCPAARALGVTEEPPDAPS